MNEVCSLGKRWSTLVVSTWLMPLMGPCFLEHLGPRAHRLVWISFWKHHWYNLLLSVVCVLLQQNLWALCSHWRCHWEGAFRSCQVTSSELTHLATSKRSSWLPPAHHGRLLLCCLWVSVSSSFPDTFLYPHLITFSLSSSVSLVIVTNNLQVSLTI